MIPFASQRGHGEDLATHLMNEMDNEVMEVAEVRGAVARDLHGAFAEWEAQARGLTRCRNYLYSLSINPDPAQRPLTREEYLAYIDAAEEKLGLTGQPRAIVFHIKNGREHCHAVWSRIDAAQARAVHMAFDHDKLMMVTREFAQERGLRLPDGYYKEKEGKSRQATLYEQVQQNLTGITQEERKKIVTRAWRQSDNAKAFVRALEANGYILATGRRPYLLVDLYGQVNALARLIDDKEVRTKDIRARLEKDFPPESLPSPEEAQELAAQHRQAAQDFAKANAKAGELSRLEERQAHRRQKLEAETAEDGRRRAGEQGALKDRHRRERDEARDAYLAELRRIRQERRDRAPKGFSAIFSRISGISRIREIIQRGRDRKLYEAFIAGRLDLRLRQQEEERALEQRHRLQRLDGERKLRVLAKVEARERASLETKTLAQQRIRQRGDARHMPAFRLELKPRGRPAAPHKAKNRYTSPIRDQFREAPRKTENPKEPRSLSEEFQRAAEDEETGESGGSASGMFKPAAVKSLSGKEARRMAHTSPGMKEFNRVATEAASGESSGTEDVAGEKPVSEQKTRRRRRRPRRREAQRDAEARRNEGGASPGSERETHGASRSRKSREPKADERESRPKRIRKRDLDRDQGM